MRTRSIRDVLISLRAKIIRESLMMNKSVRQIRRILKVAVIPLVPISSSLQLKPPYQNSDEIPPRLSKSPTHSTQRTTFIWKPIKQNQIFQNFEL